MPKLSLYAVCERAILEEGTKSLSLVTVFTGIKIGIPAEPPAPNAAIPKDWYIAAGWDGEEGDEGKTFVQVIDVSLPDGAIFVSGARTPPFTLAVGKRHHLTSRLVAFPIGQAGKCRVQIWLESEGKQVNDKTSLYFAVEHERADAAPQ